MPQPTSTAPAGGPSVPLSQPQQPSWWDRIVHGFQNPWQSDIGQMAQRGLHGLFNPGQSDIGQMLQRGVHGLLNPGQSDPARFFQQLLGTDQLVSGLTDIGDELIRGVNPNLAPPPDIVPQEGGYQNVLRPTPEQVQLFERLVATSGVQDDPQVIEVLNNLRSPLPSLSIADAYALLDNRKQNKLIETSLAGFETQYPAVTGRLEDLIRTTGEEFDVAKTAGEQFYDPAIARMNAILTGGTGGLYGDPEAYNALNVVRGAGENFVAEQTRQAAQRAASRGGGARGAEAGTITGAQGEAFKAIRGAETAGLAGVQQRRDALASGRSGFLSNLASSRASSLSPLQSQLTAAQQFGQTYPTQLRLDPNRYFNYQDPFANITGAGEAYRSSANENSRQMLALIQGIIGQAPSMTDILNMGPSIKGMFGGR